VSDKIFYRWPKNLGSSASIHETGGKLMDKLSSGVTSQTLHYLAELVTAFINHAILFTVTK
jgi:hypothetical protein